MGQRYLELIETTALLGTIVIRALDRPLLLLCEGTGGHEAEHNRIY